MFGWMRNRVVMTVLLGAALIYAAYEVSLNFFVYASDAYVTTDVVALAPQVAGPLKSIAVKQNQQVKAGDLLYTIDPTPYRIDLEAKQAELTLAETGSAETSGEIRSAQGQIASAEAALDDAGKVLNRQRQLLREGATTQQSVDDAERNYRQAEAELQRAKAALSLAQNKDPVTAAKINAAQKAVAAAEYNLKQTQVHAPVDGMVAPFSARPGDYIKAGEDVLAVIADDGWRLVVNLRERHLEGLEEEMPVSFTLSTEGWTFHRGTIESLSPGIAREPVREGVVPYVEPTTDWIRLPRRFPVRIDMGTLPQEQRLFMGADADVIIWY